MNTKEFITACDDRALKALLFDLANRGFGLSTLETVKENLNKTSYDAFAKLLSKSLNLDFSKVKNDPRLYDYITDLSKDITNQYGALRQTLIANDLNYNWFRYLGSNLTTTRPFCLAMTQKDYFHSAEISSIIKGKFPEFEDQTDHHYEETEIPTGMYLNTDETNFHIYRGGYGCGHQIHPISESVVPVNIKTQLYETEKYKIWVTKNSS